MDNSIELLQKQLQEKIERLDKERAEQTASFNKEREERRIIEEAEREERIRKIKEAEQRVIERKAEIERAEAERAKEATEARLRSEQLVNEQQELVRKQQEKLEWLTNEISKAEFVEEQHRKTLEGSGPIRTIGPISDLDESIVDAHILTGEAAVGTEGLEVGPDMSSHLKRILRIANNR